VHLYAIDLSPTFIINGRSQVHIDTQIVFKEIDVLCKLYLIFEKTPLARIKICVNS
jgi:hypothetical protein